jgi:hypothetical protein
MTRMRKYPLKERLARDVWLLILSIAGAVYIASENVVPALLASAHTADYLASFIAGMFFTSLFTIAPSGVAFAELAGTSSPWLVAFFGAAGAVAGDLILFSFVEGTLSDDIKALFSRSWRHKVSSAFNSPLMRWVTPLIGGLIIALPLPDEMGLALLGMSHVRLAVFIPISFAANFIGIFTIALTAASL